MRLTAENRAFLKAHGLKINDAISLLIAQENDARENGGTLFPASKRKRGEVMGDKRYTEHEILGKKFM